jgi:hypothetical protein
MRQLKENPKERMWGRKYYKKIGVAYRENRYF